jgi:pimeloyl-ACP methyl ester carboxylesterase
MAVTAGATEVRPFSVEFPAADIEDLRARIAATRFPERETVPDDTQGVELATMRALMKYWGNDYDFGRVESRLNAVPQFMTEIDGLDIHFIHVRSPHENALPLIMTHGWPGSVVEMLNVIPLLTDPTAHGADAGDAFHLVIPSMPGYGFSARPSSPGWNPDRIARAWVELMKRLGYTRFVAQGGDWGAIVTDHIGALGAPEVAGIHTNMPGAVPPEISALVASGTPEPDGLSPEESYAYGKLLFLYTKGIGYATQMSLRPQTLYGIADSPAGLAAWMIDHDAQSYEEIAQAFVEDRPVDNLTRDEVLDNITLTWLTNTGISSARLYWENAEGFFDVKGVTVPAAVSVFPRELYQAPRQWAEQAYPKLIYFNEVERGNHFAAWQEPELFAAEVRAGFRTLR